MPAGRSDPLSLRLAVVIKRFVTTGGAERYAVETTRRLRARGHQVALVAREWEPAAVEGLGKHRLSDRGRWSSVVSSWWFARDAARCLAAVPTDAVIAHERGFRQDIAVVHTFPYRRGIARYAGWRRIDQLYLSPRSWLHLHLEAQQMRTTHLAAVSQTIRSDIAQYYRRRRNVAVVHPGVDLERFAPGAQGPQRAATRAAVGAAPEDTLIVFVGTEFKRKGLDDLMAALGPGQRLVAVGKGERWPRYRRLVERLGIAERVHFAGFVADVRPYYQAADLLVLPSLAEAFGMCVLEAMACGLPVVVRAAAGAAALVAHGRNGFVFTAAEELPPLLARLNDPALRGPMGAEARRTACRFTWDAAADRLEALCRQVAAGSAVPD